MTPRRYFQVSVLLPVLVQVPIMLLLGRTSQFIALAYLLYYSTIIGGLPYLLFFIGVLVWTRGQDWRTIQRMTFISPVLFAAFFLVCAVVVITIQYFMLGKVRVEANELPGFCFVFLMIGYVYVLLINAGYFILRAASLIESP
jgi:hypothetical protein